MLGEFEFLAGLFVLFSCQRFGAASIGGSCLAVLLVVVEFVYECLGVFDELVVYVVHGTVGSVEFVLYFGCCFEWDVFEGVVVFFLCGSHGARFLLCACSSCCYFITW